MEGHQAEGTGLFGEGLEWRVMASHPVPASGSCMRCDSQRHGTGEDREGDGSPGLSRGAALAAVHPQLHVSLAPGEAVGTTGGGPWTPWEAERVLELHGGRGSKSTGRPVTPGPIHADSRGWKARTTSLVLGMKFGISSPLCPVRVAGARRQQGPGRRALSLP